MTMKPLTKEELVLANGTPMTLAERVAGIRQSEPNWQDNPPGIRQAAVLLQYIAQLEKQLADMQGDIE